MASWDNVQVPMQSYSGPLLNLMQAGQQLGQKLGGQQQQPLQQGQQAPNGGPMNLVPQQAQPQQSRFAASPIGKLASGLGDFIGIGGNVDPGTFGGTGGGLGGLY